MTNSTQNTARVKDDNAKHVNGRVHRNIKPRPEHDYDPEKLIDDEDAEPDASPEVSFTEMDPTIKQLEVALGRQGKIAKTLESSTYQLKDSEWRQDNGLGRHLSPILEQVLHGVSFGFRQVQMEFLDRTFKDAKSAKRTVIAACNSEGFDSVLAYAIADHSGLADLCRAIEEQAVAAYIANSDEYDLVLRDQIPQKLRKRAAAHVAHRKYFDGTHATARGDWDVFLSQSSGATNGLPTGLPGLDDALGGGISGLTILGANEGDGKTSLLLNAVVSALREDENIDCLILTIDQPKRTTLERLYCLATRCDKRTLKLPPDKRPSELNRQISDGITELQDSLLPRMRLIEKPNLRMNEGISEDTLLGYYQELNHKTQATHGILGIDMFQSLDRFPDNVTMDNDKDDFRLNVIGHFMQRTRSSSCPNGFPVITTSEIRKVDRNCLTSNDLRGSARLGSLAINIFLLWPPENTNQYGDVVPRVLNVAKSRPGDKAVLQLQFHHKICRFTEMPPVVSTPQARSNAGGNARTAGLDSKKAL